MARTARRKHGTARRMHRRVVPGNKKHERLPHQIEPSSLLAQPSLRAMQFTSLEIICIPTRTTPCHTDKSVSICATMKMRLTIKRHNSLTSVPLSPSSSPHSSSHTRQTALKLSTAKHQRFRHVSDHPRKNVINPDRCVVRQNSVG